MKTCDKHTDCLVVFEPTQWQHPCPVCQELDRMATIIHTLAPSEELAEKLVADSEAGYGYMESLKTRIERLKHQIAEGIGQ